MHFLRTKWPSRNTVFYRSNGLKSSKTDVSCERVEMARYTFALSFAFLAFLEVGLQFYKVKVARSLCPLGFSYVFLILLQTCIARFSRKLKEFCDFWPPVRFPFGWMSF